MTAPITPHPLLDLPADVRAVLTGSLVCEYASLTRDGRPVTWPVTPYVGSGGTLDVSTGLAYPDKAERARRDARVALLYSDPTGLADGAHPVVLVRGRAAVRDADLQANTDRYVRESLARTTGFDRTPWFLVRRFDWYFARIWVEVTPEEIVWWPDGDLSRAPVTVRVARVVTSGSDPAPQGARPASGQPAPQAWQPFADRAARLGAPVLTTTVDGHPLPLRVRAAERTGKGWRLTPPEGVAPGTGPACLTFHRAAPALATQENVVFVGHVDADGGFTVERALNDWSLPGGSRHFLRAARRLKPRLRVEAARRGQPVPRVRRSA